MTTRREVLIALGTGALAAPLLAFGQQQGKVARVGFLSPRSRPASLDADYYGGLPVGLRELGYVEGKNLSMEWRFADNKIDSLPALAQALVQSKVDVIVTPGTDATMAAQKATSTIPVVSINAGDLVAMGFAASLARPGSNITGIMNFAQDLSTKHLEMLLSMAPKLARVAVLINKPRGLYTDTALKNVQAASVTSKTYVNILPFEAGNTQEIESAFSSMTREKAGAVIVLQGPLFYEQRKQIAALAAKHRLPSVSSYREYAEAGCLMSYGENNTERFRRAATYVDKILEGAKPGDLPIEQPTTFEMIINGKTAKALGLTIPPTLLASANKVIE